MPADVIVVGGGPVGLATGIQARLAGLTAMVLDKRSGPLDKACGEGLMPPGVRELGALGVEVPAWGRNPFVGIRYHDGEIVAEGRFGSGPGLGVRRTALSEAMLARAHQVGVDVQLETKVIDWQRAAPGRVDVRTTRGDLSARLLVGADGLHSQVRKRAGLERATQKRRRFGMRRHFHLQPWSEFVEVHWSDEAEAYVTPVGPNLVGVAFLRHGKGANFDALMERFPTLATRLATAEHASTTRGAGPFRQDVLQPYAADLALVGDAAGYLDPLTGEGMTLGLSSARALVETVAAGQPLAAYGDAYRRLSRNYYRTTGMLLSIAARPRLRRRVVAMLAERPDLFSTMLAVNAGEAPLSSIGIGGALGMLTGVLRPQPRRRRPASARAAALRDRSSESQRPGT